MDDLQIIEECQKGNYDNFSKLYDKYIDKIYNFIFLKTYNKEIAEDLTSDTFFKLLNKIDLVDVSGSYNFSSWLYKIAYNNVIDFYKSKKDELSLESIYDISFNDNLGEKIDNKNKIKEVLNFINTLKKDHRDILIMRLWDNYKL